jgi:hypothetical protein
MNFLFIHFLCLVQSINNGLVFTFVKLGGVQYLIVKVFQRRFFFFLVFQLFFSFVLRRGKTPAMFQAGEKRTN